MQTMTCTRRQMVRHDLAIPLMPPEEFAHYNSITFMPFLKIRKRTLLSCPDQCVPSGGGHIRIHKNRQINAVTLAKCVQHLNSFKLKIYKM